MVVAVLGVLLAGGIPALLELVADAQLTAQVNDWVTAVHVARQAAFVRGRNVTLCPSDADLRCDDGGDWQQGWLVVLDNDDGPPAVLLQQRPWVNGRIRANRRAFSFRPFGRRDTNGTVSFCDARGLRSAKAVIISPTGKPRQASRGEVNSRVTC